MAISHEGSNRKRGTEGGSSGARGQDRGAPGVARAGRAGWVPWVEVPGRLQSMGSQRVVHN